MLKIKEPVCEARIALSDGTFISLTETGMGGHSTGNSTPRDRILNKLQSWRRDGGGFAENDLWIPFHSIVRIQFSHKEDKDQ